MGKGTDQVEFAQRLGRRPEPELAKLGSTIICGVRHPHPHTISMTLETPAAVDYANLLLQDKARGWRLETPNAEVSGRASEAGEGRA